MSRFFYFGLLLAITTSLLSAPISAQTSVGKSSSASARIQEIAVHGNGDAVEVEIHTSGAVAPNTQAITAPDRIIVDFPGALPAEGMRALTMKVNSGALKGIRTGLFFNNPPIMRVVLDLSEPQSYQILTTKNAVILKLHAPGADGAKLEPSSEAATGGATVSIVRTPRPQNGVMAGNAIAGGAKVDPAAVPASIEATAAPPPPKPLVTVTFVDGMLTIHADKATLAQVLFEVQQKTQAEMAIPAGAEQEQIISDLGPAPAREVLASLLNGSPYNFIFVGSELNLERVIITKRDPNSF